ncbi:MAG: hypothetical protein HKN94_04385 [Acidimicrobiales bacterium]|nr:hypothetical protein [Acidimicrobiia bacterium]NNC79373.1 hypothetical protein [Acidimicrobiales bacterium]RZV45205.1 MAG: hypothetical protein EX269_10525 [Acidimicrobiales bacterium]
MAITEKDRRDLFNELEDKLGTRPATTVMELLPAHPASSLVTREDMHSFGATLRAEVHGEIAELRADMVAGFATAKVETQRLIAAGIAANVLAVVTALVA